ncbi:MAG TPA: hypothetical protein VLX29_06655 [Nitrospirota bacterium]|nr:hypothetical protein [Nitrospirota bacterium]
MAQEGRTLDNGAIFPEMSFDSIAGGTIILPADLFNSWTVLLFYRGHW